MRAIPKKYLCHSAAMTLKFAPDKWGKASGNVSGTMENVRFEPMYSHENSVVSNGAKYNARLFVDAVNSVCALPLLNVGDTYDGHEITAETITFDGREYDVAEIKRFYDDRRLHHWEVLLNG